MIPNRFRLLAAAGVVALIAGCAPGQLNPSEAGPGPSEAPAATVTVTVTPTNPAPSSTSAPAGAVVVVYFGNSVLDPDVDCSKVWGLPRSVPSGTDRLTAALSALLAGPTPQEVSQGYNSFFSAATADALIKAKATADTAYVNLTDLRTVIPNASTSCGSAALLAQLTTTAQQAAGTPKVRFAFEGQPKPFWEWLQSYCSPANDDCDPAPFQG